MGRGVTEPTGSESVGPIPELLPEDALPVGFAYPPELLRILRLGLVDLEPWLVLRGEPLLALHHGLRTRYPARHLVPFARRTDRDDVACWDLEPGAAPICVVGDYEVPGYEQGETHATFYGWFRSAVDDLVEWDDESLSAS
ncbi:hypothetical protein DFJ68_3426 [Terracoccus luteus]|uniref:SUKH superfamily protein n=1 Tax=Terracoccus luteus TaxID=53356 RepID=A0A495Y078_9MICO|nr:hypothetical protein DFJ68_3426 [Terracoccus luteus]